MSKLDTQNINVLNYNENSVFVDSNKDHYKFNASRDGKTPSVIPMSLSELTNIASNTEIINTGWLTFDEDVKEDIYTELRMPNWKDILTNEDIANILQKPTMIGLQKIVDIKNQTYFDRVRIIMFKLINDGVDITTKVNGIIDQRYAELRNKQRVSSLSLTAKDTRTYATPDDVSELSKQNKSLQLQLDEMKQMMEQMVLVQSKDVKETIVKTDVQSNEVKQVPKAGRPKKTT